MSRDPTYIEIVLTLMLLAVLWGNSELTKMHTRIIEVLQSVKNGSETVAEKTDDVAEHLAFFRKAGEKRKSV